MKRHKGKKSLGVLILVTVLILSSCANGNKSEEKQTETGNESSTESQEYSFLEEKSTETTENDSSEKRRIDEVSISWDGSAVWNDNSTDDLRAVINHPVEKTEAEGEIHGNGEIFVCEAGCVRHSNHTFSNYKEDWDGVNGITGNGEKFSLKIEVDSGREGAQIRNLGSVSGKKGYVACYHGTNKNGKPADYWFYELDEAFAVVNAIHPNLNANAFIRSLMGDSNGNFHVTYDGNGGKRNYVIISSAGELLFEKEVEVNSKLCSFGGGRVALCETTLETNERRFMEANAETGELSEIAVSKDEAVKKMLTSNDVYDAVPVDDHQILTCNKEGVCFYDLRDRKLELAYKWSNHGIIPLAVRELGMTSDGSVSILYEEKGEKGTLFLLLKPTGEKEELKSITIAVSAENAEKYGKAAAYFQKKYPEYVINVKDDYDETSLLTQLGAGKGPVLVDTALTGFEDLERLWQPLDGFLEQTGIAEEMLPGASEFGKIGGVTYGIVREFQIKTLLTTDNAPDDWNYEGYLNALENFDGKIFTGRYVETAADWREKYFDALMNGLGDNYYFNVETGETIFGTSKFERVLRISRKAMQCPPAASGEAIKKGEAFCECVDVFSVEGAVRLRRRMQINGEKITGYPTNAGARNLLCAISPVALCRTATDEEKTIAYTFLKVYLSKEAMQEDVSFLPVRKDVLTDTFARYQATAEQDAEFGIYNPEVMPELDWDEDVKFLNDLIEKGAVKKTFPAGLQKVFDEELGDYLNGRIDEKALTNHLKSRVWLYLEEMK